MSLAYEQSSFIPGVDSLKPDADDVLWQAFTAADWLEAREGEPKVGEITILSPEERHFYLGIVAEQIIRSEVVFDRSETKADAQNWDNALGSLEDLWSELGPVEDLQNERF